MYLELQDGNLLIADAKQNPAICTNVFIGKGGIEIIESGYYFIYSHVDVLDYAYEMDKTNKELVHKIVRYHYLYPDGKETLLKSIKSKNIIENRHTITTSSFLGAMIHLIKGDKLVVNISKVTRLAAIQEGNYLGLTKLS